MFGLFALSGKATAFMGPFLVATATAISGSQRVGMATIAILLVIGGLLMLSLKPESSLPARAGQPIR
jgi:UMF1 family MFS transporter